jgi:hypothetical protein
MQIRLGTVMLETKVNGNLVTWRGATMVILRRLRDYQNSSNADPTQFKFKKTM